MNKSFQKTIHLESVRNLCDPNIVNPWRDAHAAFDGQEKAKACQENGNEEKEQDDNDPMQLPTQGEAIKITAKNEVDLYLGT